MRYPEISLAELMTLRLKKTFSSQPGKLLDLSIKLGELHLKRREILIWNKNNPALFQFPISLIDEAIEEVEKEIDYFWRLEEFYQ